MYQIDQSITETSFACQKADDIAGLPNMHANGPDECALRTGRAEGVPGVAALEKHRQTARRKHRTAGRPAALERCSAAGCGARQPLQRRRAAGWWGSDGRGKSQRGCVHPPLMLRRPVQACICVGA